MRNIIGHDFAFLSFYGPKTGLRAVKSVNINKKPALLGAGCGSSPLRIVSYPKNVVKQILRILQIFSGWRWAIVGRRSPQRHSPPSPSRLRRLWRVQIADGSQGDGGSQGNCKSKSSDKGLRRKQKRRQLRSFGHPRRMPLRMTAKGKAKSRGERRKLSVRRCRWWILGTCRR